MGFIKFWPMIIKPYGKIGSMDVSFKGKDQDFATTIGERMKKEGYVLKASWHDKKGTLMHFVPKVPTGTY